MARLSRKRKAMAEMEFLPKTLADQHGKMELNSLEANLRVALDLQVFNIEHWNLHHFPAINTNALMSPYQNLYQITLKAKAMDAGFVTDALSFLKKFGLHVQNFHIPFQPVVSHASFVDEIRLKYNYPPQESKLLFLHAEQEHILLSIYDTITHLIRQTFRQALDDFLPTVLIDLIQQLDGTNLKTVIMNQILPPRIQEQKDYIYRNIYATWEKVGQKLNQLFSQVPPGDQPIILIRHANTKTETTHRVSNIRRITWTQFTANVSFKTKKEKILTFCLHALVPNQKNYQGLIREYDIHTNYGHLTSHGIECQNQFLTKFMTHQQFVWQPTNLDISFDACVGV